jgi:hypothetical protein
MFAASYEMAPTRLRFVGLFRMRMQAGENIEVKDKIRFAALGPEYHAELEQWERARQLNPKRGRPASIKAGIYWALLLQMKMDALQSKAGRKPGRAKKENADAGDKDVYSRNLAKLAKIAAKHPSTLERIRSRTAARSKKPV